MGGIAMTQVYEGEKRFDLTVRWLEQYRSSLESIRELTISTPAGGNVPLGQMAKIAVSEGPSNIYREDGQRYTPVKFSVRGRDLESTIAEARATHRRRRSTSLRLAPRLGGRDQPAQRGRGSAQDDPARSRCCSSRSSSTARPRAGSTRSSCSSTSPSPRAGGVLALLVTGIHFSVSAAMGFISIFGIAVQDAILVVTYFQRLRERRGAAHPRGRPRGLREATPARAS